MIRVLIAAAILLAPATADARVTCGPREIIVKSLKERHGEVRVAVGLNDRGAATEVYVNPSTRSWTIIVTDPKRGASCIVAAGRPWFGSVRAIAPGLDL